ncbi:hypothetical protein ACPOL_6596 [Acidisarcina polymorpha]|uniref:Uncharacterized protein n=1 Tax=Acidisarcina polymorpha TaxID=2211140 RepID=A0A2Z5G9X9_9BACT|nr:hypothetical protein ACPOL_6596 [Acidisarcina polymorpha]
MPRIVLGRRLRDFARNPPSFENFGQSLHRETNDSDINPVAYPRM